MTENIFLNKEVQPDEKKLKSVLGQTCNYFNHIQEFTIKTVGETREEWKYYGKKYGWQLKTIFKKRNLYFVIFYEGFFKIIFIFGDKAVKKIEESDISPALVSELVNAKKYLEGRGLSINVEDAKYVNDIIQLIQIKVNY